MRRNALWRIVLALVLVVTTLAATAAVASAAGPVPVGDLKPGDIVFMRNSKDAWAKSTYWTHNGLYIGDYSGSNGMGKRVKYKHAIVEATSRGVVVNNLEDPAHWWTVYHGKVGYGVAAARLREAKFANWADITKAAVAYAKSKVGTRYDFFFNRKTDKTLYCSELVWWAYWQSNVDLDRNGGTMIYPDDQYFYDDLVQIIATDPVVVTAIAS